MYKTSDIICGVDEAGRGPLAGPVTASAVILPLTFPVYLLNDSKAISPVKRKKIAGIIRRLAVFYSVGWCWPHEIDTINIHNATLLAMKRAIKDINPIPTIVLVDGCFIPDIPYPCRSIIKGDKFVRQIQAASIIAKTTRDLWMERYSRIESSYEFEQHKGYATKKHRAIVKSLGLSPIHRRSFKIKN